MKAALRLSAQRRSISDLGIRELAREAGLHHTAIYRHFQSIETVAVALVERLSTQLRADLRKTRREAAQGGQDLVRASTERYFEYVKAHPQGVIFCAREMHGALPVLREALHQMLDDFASDTAFDLATLSTHLQLPDEETLLVLTRLIAEQTLFAALDYLEQVERRPEIVERSTLSSKWLIAGAVASQKPAATALPAPKS